MGRFQYCCFRAVWVLLSVQFECASAAASAAAPKYVSTAADRGLRIKFTTMNHINYDGANGECTIKCEAHDTAGVFTMGTVDLRKGEQETWSKLVDENGPDFIHCEFSWTSMTKLIDYDLFSENMDHVQPIITMWTVTEVGLFQLTPTGKSIMVIGWSG